MCCLGTPLPQLLWQPEQGSRAGFKGTTSSRDGHSGQGQTQPTAASCPARAKTHKFQCIALKKVFISLQARKFLTSPPVPEEDKLPHW